MAWDVTIRAEVTKTIRIESDEAESEQEAVELAHSQFTATPDPDDTKEKYEEYTLDVKEV